MKLLAIMRPPPQTDVRAAIAQRAADELRALWHLYRDGVVREMYSPGGPGAVLVLETDSIASARSALEQLPLRADGVMTLDLIELHPFAAVEMLFQR
jgi:hypothetical protein